MTGCDTVLVVLSKCFGTSVVFVTGRGGVGSHSPGPALTRGRGVYLSGNPCPAPARGPPALIPWTGPRLLPHIFNRDPSGVWVGRGPERAQGQGMPKTAPHPRPLSGAGRGKGPGARVFRGSVRPVTNSRRRRRDPRRDLAEIPSSIVSSGWHVDDRSCARSGARHHFYSIVAILP